MSPALNQKQAEKLADFSFDIAKGLLLGSVAYATTGNFSEKILLSLTGMLISLFLVSLGLNLTSYD